MEHDRRPGGPEGSPAAEATEDRLRARYHVYTDLAVEAREVIVEREGPPEIPGVRVQNETIQGIPVSRVDIESDLGAQMMGKLKGHYVTIEAEPLRRRDRQGQVSLRQVLAQELQQFLERLGIGQQDSVLVVGLGNWNATPDNVGPQTVAKLLVTRHLFTHQALPPDQLAAFRPVMALAPGVLGLTGIETAEIVRGVVERAEPALVICVDALAARSAERLGTTIQMADVGIAPGSGVGNKRQGLNQETLGVPVLAIGVPTVIYAMTLVSEALERLTHDGAAPASGGTSARGAWPAPATVAPPEPQPAVPAAAGVGREGGRLDPSRIRFEAAWLGALFDPGARQQLLREVLGPFMGTMVVTPKEIDTLVDDVSDVLADAMNEALHPGISAEEAAQLR